MLFSHVEALNAQKIIKKSVLTTRTTLVNIDAGQCFLLTVENSDSDLLQVYATIDGEYKKDLAVNIKEEGNTLSIHTDFQPLFKNPNDKLSAHKVVSIALVVKVPNGKNLTVNGTSCMVAISGFFKNISVVLDDGMCTLKNITETAKVRTQSGNIVAFVRSADIKSKTKYGKVHTEAVPKGESKLDLASVTGNIYLKKTD
ncbi:DUF4097 family beta strand repeat-containing protein [Costertonia aggregata]|uniref:DUF4097 family beta strand repeat protein n=1 Tax=Costertonia aggregata TaxID=343403 RepID=A0A7H9AQ48_9FLAO|nr:DUF4097 family beta strand repeat-containing protein [Costertonia aggregata]QLG45554.1 hypothetical protein HYG79_09415 [Costertonia aggregata]